MNKQAEIQEYYGGVHYTAALETLQSWHGGQFSVFYIPQYNFRQNLLKVEKLDAIERELSRLLGRFNHHAEDRVNLKDAERFFQAYRLHHYPETHLA